MVKKDKVFQERIKNIQMDQTFIDIKLKIDGYRHFNDKIMNEMEPYMNVLDTKYNLYQRYLNIVHISIIIFSSFISFLLASQPYFHSSEHTIKLSSLCISTYSSLLLSISKFMKLEEHKESLYRLRSEFAEFLIEMRSRNDVLECWSSHNVWKTKEENETMTKHLSTIIGIDAHVTQCSNFEICLKEWNDIERQLKDQMTDLIKKKQILCSEYTQEMDSKFKYKTEILSKRRMLLHKNDMNELNNITLNELKEKMKWNCIQKNIFNSNPNEMIEDFDSSQNITIDIGTETDENTNCWKH